MCSYSLTHAYKLQAICLTLIAPSFPLAVTLHYLIIVISIVLPRRNGPYYLASEARDSRRRAQAVLCRTCPMRLRHQSSFGFPLKPSIRRPPPESGVFNFGLKLRELLLSSSPQQAARGALNARVHGGGLDDRQMLVRDFTTPKLTIF